MANKKKKNNKNVQNKKNTKKKINPLPIIATAVVIVAAISIIVPNLTKDKTDNGGTTDPAPQVQQPTPQGTAGDIVIDESAISATAAFYDYNADGTTVEIFAVKASDGSNRIAFNTCQSCYGSPYAYFIQQGDVLQCQNCGQYFELDSVGIVHGGCNPIPITAENYENADGKITVSAEFLGQYKATFTNWKKGI